MTTPASRAVSDAFLKYVNRTGSPHYSVREAVAFLDAAGFVKVSEREPYPHDLKGKTNKFYVTRAGTTLAAFVVGGQAKAADTSFVIAGAHTDSPCLKVRPVTKVGTAGHYLQVGVQTYGGGLWHTWFDRELGVAGEIVYRNGEGFVTQQTVRIAEPLLFIPNMAIHLQSMDERKAFVVNTEQHLQPVLGKKKEEGAGGRPAACDARGPEACRSLPISARQHDNLLARLASEAGVDAADILDVDLCLFDICPSGYCGIDREFILSARIDNLASTFAVFDGISDFARNDAAVAQSSSVSVAVAFDHEECGSTSAAGADSAALQSMLQRTLESLALEEAKSAESITAGLFSEVMTRSILLSIDGAHGLHPNYPAKHQAEHRPVLGAGVVIKCNANQRYATTSLTSSFVREVAQRHDVSVQDFVVRNDSPCGSTIGPMLSARLGIRTVDLGAGMWAMHSCRESMHAHDLWEMKKLTVGFFESFTAIDGKASQL